MAIDCTLPPHQQPVFVGQEKAHDHMTRILSSGQIPQAWIFSGIQGIGKATGAYHMARFLWHKTPPEGFSGEQWTRLVDRQVASGTFPNLYVLTPLMADDKKTTTADITVDQVRALKNYLQQAPMLDTWRVILIDAVDNLNRQAANALLKSLEEPPARTLFILIAHSAGSVMPTIRSRCCTLSFQPFTDEALRTLFPNHPDCTAFAHGSLARYHKLTQADTVALEQQVVEACRSALTEQFLPAQQLGEQLEKNSPDVHVCLSLILWVLERIVLLTHGESPSGERDARLLDIAHLRDRTHWVDVCEKVGALLRMSHGTHLDHTHLLMAIFFIIHHPSLGDQFLHA